MSKSFEYRDKAAKCQAMADQCKDDWARAIWIETAQTWLRLSAQADAAIARKSPPKLTRSIPLA
jgi:hypothetical protein